LRARRMTCLFSLVTVTSAAVLIGPPPRPHAVSCRMQMAAAPSESADMVAAMDVAALSLDADAKPKRGADGRLQPVLTLPGDTLETTASMVALTAASTALTAAIVARAFLLRVTSAQTRARSSAAQHGCCQQRRAAPVLTRRARPLLRRSAMPLAPLLAVGIGATAGELFSGCFHWATDNYGSLRTPVVGFACAAFQGHHLAPWTISHRSVWNNVHKIASATLPLNLAAAALLPPAGAALVATMLYSQLLAQEFHRWSHTPPELLAGWQRSMQRAGIALQFREHCGAHPERPTPAGTPGPVPRICPPPRDARTSSPAAHHKPPFDKKYCILTGGLNRLLDSAPLYFWRRLEALVYRANGVEPLSWKDARIKELALSL
jgi:hypothetical protein